MLHARVRRLVQVLTRREGRRQGSGGYIYSRVLLARLTTKSNTAQHFGFMAAVSVPPAR